jgi:hypothetical protein
MMHDQGFTQGVAFLNRALTATSRAELDALPDAGMVSLRLALAGIDGDDDQASYLDGFKQAVNLVPSRERVDALVSIRGSRQDGRPLRVMTQRPTPPASGEVV